MRALKSLRLLFDGHALQPHLAVEEKHRNAPMQVVDTEIPHLTEIAANWMSLYVDRVDSMIKFVDAVSLGQVRTNMLSLGYRILGGSRHRDGRLV